MIIDRPVFLKRNVILLLLPTLVSGTSETFKAFSVFGLVEIPTVSFAKAMREVLARRPFFMYQKHQDFEISYASPAILNLQVEQLQIPTLCLLNLVEPQDGQRRVRFSVPIIRPYRFRTVEPYLAPKPFRLPCSAELDNRSTFLYNRSNLFSFKLSGTRSLQYLLWRKSSRQTFLTCTNVASII